MLNVKANKDKLPHAWHERWDVWVFLVLGLVLYGTLMFLLYHDIMNDDTSGMERAQQNYIIYTIYNGSLFVFLLIMVYLVVSLWVCAYNYKNDTQIIRTNRTLHKKVKDMSATQKAHHYNYIHAKTRMSLYTCGQQWYVAKVMTILFSMAALALHPYAKKKKSLPWFVMLAVLITPTFVLLSASILFLMYNVRFSQFVII